MALGRESRRLERFLRLDQIAAPDLEYCTQLLVEQSGDGTAGDGQLIDIDAHADVAGKHHLAQRREQPSVGAVVIREQLSRFVQALYYAEERTEFLRLIQVRSLVAQLTEDLRQGRTAQAIASTAQIDKDECGVLVQGT